MSKVITVFFALAVCIFCLFLLFAYSSRTKFKPMEENELANLDGYEKEEIYISIWDKEDFDGQIIPDESNINSHNARVVTLDAGLSKKFIESSIHKNETVLWKGAKTGLLIQNGLRRKLKISGYGHFYAIEGTQGYYVIDDEFSEQWNNAVTDFTYKPDLSGFKDYNKLLSPGKKQVIDETDHLPISFSTNETFVFCWHASPISSVDEIWKFIKWKENCGVKLAKYSYFDDEYLKRLYEDGTYFEWNEEFYGIKYILGDM